MNKIPLPNARYLLMFVIALAIVSLAARMLPENVKQYFRI